MDGSQFKRESLGLRFEKSNIGEVLDKLEAQVYYNYADHVMDNYSLRTPSGTGMMAGPMVATSTAAPSAHASRPPGAGPMCS
jgi:iron complex outermembrane receptor protein